MPPQTLFVAAVAICLVNGLISPALPVMAALWPVWMPEMLRPSPETIFYGASLLVSTGTLLVSAVPAAIAERAGLGAERAMWLWPGCAALLLLLGLR
jgi:hypothetical protein